MASFVHGNYEAKGAEITSPASNSNYTESGEFEAKVDTSCTREI